MEAHSSTNLKIWSFNAQSLELHFYDVTRLTLNNELHILAIGESWLKPNCSSEVLKVPGYNFVRVDRLGKKSSGIGIFIHDSIKYKVLSQSAQPETYSLRPEFLFVLLRIGSLKLLLGVVYSPSKSGYWHEVEEAFINCNTAFDYAIMVGDFNINWSVPSTSRKILRDSLFSCNLEPLSFSPTNHRTNSHTTIDYICVSDVTKVVSSHQQSLPGVSQHDALIGMLCSFISCEKESISMVHFGPSGPRQS